MEEAAYKYEVGINKLVHKPGQSYTEFLDWDLVKGVFKLDVFTSMKKHVAKHFKNPKLQQLLEFPVLVLGALPEKTPALYSLMNYADIKLGTWYPQGGMYKIVEGMFSVAEELGVKFLFNSDVTEIKVEHGIAREVIAQRTDNGFTDRSFSEGGQQTTNNVYNADVVIGAADYQFIETKLLPGKYRSYSDA
jgi:phytoene desaturase